MVRARFVPSKGDFIWLSFEPQSGHEQKGRRPALVLSNDLFNRHTGLVLVCPVTNTNRRFPFHLPVPPSASVQGYLMVEQVKSLDYSTRQASFIERAPGALVRDALEMLHACID